MSQIVTVFEILIAILHYEINLAEDKKKIEMNNDK